MSYIILWRLLYDKELYSTIFIILNIYRSIIMKYWWNDFLRDNCIWDAVFMGDKFFRAKQWSIKVASHHSFTAQLKLIVLCTEIATIKIRNKNELSERQCIQTIIDMCGNRNKSGLSITGLPKRLQCSIRAKKFVRV